MTASEKIEQLGMLDKLSWATPEQILYLHRVIERQGVENVKEIGMGFGGVLFVQANGMFIGIEKDGYAHT